MAEALLGAVFNLLLEKMASQEVVDFFKQRKFNDKLLQKLKRRLNTVKGFLVDAEEKQSTTPAVKKWLDDLKDAAYEADDFLDDIAYKAREQKELLDAGSNTCSDQVRNFFNSLNPCKKGMEELEPKLEEIFEKLEDLLQHKDVHHLEKRDGVPSRGRTTTSLVDESSICGRDGDKEAIIKLLLTDGEGLGVVPIVGMGGVGKTTLSQLVYKDSRVKQRFDKLRAWVCVSEEFDVLKLIKTILKEIGSRECDSKSPNALAIELEEKVRGKRILLVLDDVWNNIEWDSLLIPLKSAAQGSKILVTTRHNRVVSAVCTVPSYHLRELSEDDCWLLFAKHALYSDAYADLEEPGRKIVRKCKGLPLAAKTIGSSLRLERRVREWEKVLESNMWDSSDSEVGKIIPALRLSYHYLPPHLKQCFAYCAMFPKDFQFRRENLIRYWMGEGFIVRCSNKRREMEEIGEEYFEDLLSRSFFQKYGLEDDVFVMHDLINDLAKSIAGEFCYNNVDDANSDQVTERTRHMFCEGSESINALEELEGLSKEELSNDSEELESLLSKELSNALEELEGFSKAKLSRTFIYSINSYLEPRHVFNFLSRLRRLRVVHIYRDYVTYDETNICNLVSSARHLRFLQLEALQIPSLPEDIHTLRFLQTLIIKRCHCIASLPYSIGDIKYLRHLDLMDVSNLKSLPDSIGNLKHLRHLNLQEAQTLKSLPDSIGNLKHLRHLNLFWAMNLKSLPDSIGNLKELTHLDLGGTSLKRLPESVCGLHSLMHLSLHECRELVELPAKTMELVSLCHFDIGDTKLKSMPPLMGKLVKLQTLTDFFVGKDRGCGIAELGKLRYLLSELVLRNLQNVTDVQDAIEANLKDKNRLESLVYDWEDNDDNSDTEETDMSLLQHLKPPANVKNVVIKGYRSIMFPGDSTFSNVVALYLSQWKCCISLPPLGELASLRKLVIMRCGNLESLDCAGLHQLTSLTKLEIYFCPNLRCIPKQGLPSSLDTLFIFRCPQLEKRCLMEQGEDWPKISYIQKISFAHMNGFLEFRCF